MEDNPKKHGPMRGNKSGEKKTEYVPKGNKPHQKNYKELHLEEIIKYFGVHFFFGSKIDNSRMFWTKSH